MIRVNYATDESNGKSGMTSVKEQKKMMLFEEPMGVLPFLLYPVYFYQQVLKPLIYRCKRVTLTGILRRKSRNVSLANRFKCFLYD